MLIPLWDKVVAVGIRHRQALWIKTSTLIEDHIIIHSLLFIDTSVITESIWSLKIFTLNRPSWAKENFRKSLAFEKSNELIIALSSSSLEISAGNEGVIFQSATKPREFLRSKIRVALRFSSKNRFGNRVDNVDVPNHVSFQKFVSSHVPTTT